MNTFTGCLLDNRPQQEKDKDYLAEEVFALGAVNWEERKPISYKVRSQDGSGSCVAQTLALMLSILNSKEENRWVDFSASYIYQRRQNKGYPGMIGNDALEIVRKYGSTFEFLMPSQDMGEEAINNVGKHLSDEVIADMFRIESYLHLPFDIEKIASVIQGGNPVMVWFQFPRAEWTSEPKATSSKEDIVHHSVTAIDFVLKKGKKYLVIQDSWGLHSSTENGLRYISENYIKNRMTFAAYLTDLPNVRTNTVAKPKVKLTETLRLGSRGSQVIDLQNVLKYEGLFPDGNAVDGVFGGLTRKSTIDFQKKYGLVGDGIVGNNTRKVINSMYNS